MADDTFRVHGAWWWSLRLGRQVNEEEAVTLESQAREEASRG